MSLSSNKLTEILKHNHLSDTLVLLVGGLNVFAKSTWGQYCPRLTATGQAAAGQAQEVTSNQKDDTGKNKNRLEVFPLLIVSLLQSKTRDPVRDPSAALKHCIVIAHFSPRDTRLTASNKEVIMQQSCFCSITVSAFSALVFFLFQLSEENKSWLI